MPARGCNKVSQNGKSNGWFWWFIGVFALAGGGSAALGQGGGDHPDPTPQKPNHSYSSCDDVRKAGVTLHRGDPGYLPFLDNDLDGTACEPGEG